jgi:cell division septal protein FtsQ
VLSWKTRLSILLILFIFILTIWFFFFSPIFQINNIIISGLERANSEDIKKLVEEQMNNKKIILGHESNIFFLELEKLKRDVNSRYNFKSIDVYKKLPKTLEISITERQYAFIWQEGENCYYSDNEGYVIGQISPNPEDLKQKALLYPVIENKRANALNLEKNMIDCQEKQFILDVFNYFKQLEPAIGVDHFILSNEINTITVKVISGPEVYLNTTKDYKKQLDKLILIKNEKLQDSFNQKKYIDLRYGDTIYYQ